MRTYRFGVALLCALAMGLIAHAQEAPAYAVNDGMLGKSLIKVVVPKEWKGGDAIILCHGLRDAKEPLTADFDLNFLLYKTLLQEGWLIASTSYRRNGYVIDEAIEDIEQLREHVAATYGAPKRVFLVGGSMGGAIIAHMAETKKDVYAGALPWGAALAPRMGKYTFTSQMPLLFLCNADEIKEQRQYVARAAEKKAPVVPVLWHVKREGHCNFTGEEALAAFRGLVRFVETGACETEKDTSIDAPPPASTAVFAASAATAKVLRLDMTTAFTAPDLDKLGIKPGDRFALRFGEKTANVFFGKSYFSVKKGEWVAFLQADGYLKIARNAAKAAETLGCAIGDELTIAPAPKEG